MENMIKFITGTLLTTVMYFLGGWDIALEVLILLLVLDYITGVFKAYKSDKLNSNKGLVGILKKIGYLIIVAVAVEIDRLIGDTGAIRTLVIYFLVANEGISVLENLGQMGLPIPKVLLEKLEQLKDKDGDS